MPWPGLGNHMPPMLGPTHGVLGSQPLSPPVSHSKRPPPSLLHNPHRSLVHICGSCLGSHG